MTKALCTREKLLARGPKSLEDAELIALLLHGDPPGHTDLALAQSLLDSLGSVAAALAAPWEEMSRQPGMNLAGYAALQAGHELARRAFAEPVCERALLNHPARVSQFLVSQLGGLQREVFAALFLDSHHRLIRFEPMFSGSLSQTSVYPREVVKRALQLNAAAVIAAHNHPSGLAQASQADHLLTAQLRRALSSVDISLLDHLIVAGGTTTSA